MFKEDKKKTSRLYTLTDAEIALTELKNSKPRIQAMIQKVKLLKDNIRTQK
jgi:hypothetical protein